MSAHEGAIDQQHSGTTKLFVMVWVYLLALTAIEVFLAYERLAVILMLVILIGLIFALAASIAPIGLLVFRRYIRVPEADRQDL